MILKHNPREVLSPLLRSLKLPAFVLNYMTAAERAEHEGWTYEQYLYQLVEIELEERRQHRVTKHLKQSKLPFDKTLATLDLKRLPAKIARQVPILCHGDFVGRAENILAFGLPGRGKTHVLCAIGHELIKRNHTVLFIPAFKLVQRLLAAKRDLNLDKELQRLDKIDVILVDDIGYVKQDREEMEVLFTFLSQRYERRSIMISSNLVFSQWDRIFKDPMTTAAAIDRVVHHSIILEMTGGSIREEDAKARQRISLNQESTNESGEADKSASRL